MASVLVAALGESPIVVTAMVKALREHSEGPGVEIDEVFLLYPDLPTQRYIWRGKELIESELKGKCRVNSWPLDVKDIDSYASSLMFLRNLGTVLDACLSHDVYLSLAGGRKNMAALMVAVAQFYPNVKGLYHVLDAWELDPVRRNFYTIEELDSMTRGERHRRMNPPVESLKLVQLPFASLAEAARLRQYLKRAAEKEELIVPLEGAAEVFFRNVFGSEPISSLLEIRFSSVAVRQYREIYNRDRNRAEKFWKCFQMMHDPNALKGHIRGTLNISGKEYHFYKERRSVERPLYWTEPNPIHLYPHRDVKRVVVAGLAVRQDDGTYDPSHEEWKQYLPFDASYTLADLQPLNGVLIVPLGESPMVATQAFALLRSHGVTVEAVALVYPGENGVIRNGVRLLGELFTRADLTSLRGSDPVPVKNFPVDDLADIDTTAAARQFAARMRHAISAMADQYPGRELCLLLSGGRKIMAAITYYAAQVGCVGDLYHTVISEVTIDDLVEAETALDAMDREGLTLQQKAERLFMHPYPRSAFQLFKVPVIRLQ